jgi:sugar lactone lactonase YvrE
MDDLCKEPTGRIWSLSPDGSMRSHADGFIVGNGFGWSLDNRRMYFTDSEARQILAYDFDLASGTLGNRRCFAMVDSAAGYPDGLVVDADDHVWSAHWDGGCITRYKPDGTVERVVTLPIPRPTSLAFGGPDLQSLFITSARIGLDGPTLHKAPLSGGLFELRLADVKGMQPMVFGVGARE